ncbi:hypothetical protein HID58_093510 [Brassica napus]|uniref:BnaA05g20380D protein n=3 Tax=Brassica TaxID=3705 RepID=A0A078FZ59_BRANA|nr:hypothetical protein HID58_093510 [Brassica napus]CAF2099770.1 unnamed protein product [Brassica napus]CAG7876909.1 unnamed protein product [Brassica rapa]CDY19630.1 BnaA05g20380D [Brassica napus]VDC71998.1 unnamed protein product [Brassica rapa]
MSRTRPIHLDCQSCYRYGRERRIADIPTDYVPFMQQAACCLREMEKEKSDGVRLPYIMDLGSTNETYVNVGSAELPSFLI